MTLRPLAALSIAGLAATAPAQTLSFVYHIDVGSSILAPGETTTVTARCGFSPGIGQTIVVGIGPRLVLGLSSGSFNLLGSGGNWTLGTPPNGSLIAPLNFLPGTTHGVAAGGNVSGVLWGNGFGPPLGTVSTVNPTPLWQATFTAPVTPGPITLNIQPVGSHGVWAGNPGEFAVEVLSNQTTGAQTIINVIPAPPSLALVAVVPFATTRRRRSRP